MAHPATPRYTGRIAVPVPPVDPMSYHQYYEFLALDRALTATQLAEVRKISSRASVSATRFAVAYDYGDLKADPDEMLERWFDLHLYRSPNFRRVVVKVPAKCLPSNVAETYGVDEVQLFSGDGDQLTVAWQVEDDSGDWVDDEDAGAEAAELVPVRAALLRGELWPLYLGWLSDQYLPDDRDDDDEDDEEAQPPVPAGLSATDPVCCAFAAFVGVDYDLLAAVAEYSRPATGPEEQGAVVAWLAEQPAAAKDAALATILLGTTGEALPELRQQLARWRTTQVSATQVSPSLASLMQRASALAAERICAESARAARERAAHLAGIASQAKELWTRVLELRESRASSDLQFIVRTLLALRDAADHHGTRAEFDRFLAVYVAPLSPSRALHRRLVADGLLPKGR